MYENFDGLCVTLIEMGFKKHPNYVDTLFFTHNEFGDICFNDNGYRLNFIQTSGGNRFKVFYHWKRLREKHLEEKIIDYASMIVEHSLELRDDLGDKWFLSDSILPDIESLD